MLLSALQLSFSSQSGDAGEGLATGMEACCDQHLESYAAREAAVLRKAHSVHGGSADVWQLSMSVSQLCSAV